MVYCLNMASIISKKVSGQTYYYLREMARIDGKPKMVSERYLGKASDIEAAMAGAQVMPERTRHLGFGDLAATWSMLGRLGVTEIIDSVVGARRADAGASVGTYIGLATANRVVAPCSKLGFADWWKTTAGDRLVKLASGATDHRRFWDAMNEITPAMLDEIEAAITARVVELFDLDCSGLVLDMTNFATYIDSGNDRAPIAQRGHAKQKRNDLRLVGLGLVVTRDGAIPLVHHAYAGNRPDVTQFPDVIRLLAERFGSIAEASDLTVVYDAGQDSSANQLVIEETGMHFVGSLRPSDHADLLAIARSRYRVVDEAAFPGLSAFQSTTMALGAMRRVIVTHSDELHAAQARGFEQTLGKARRRLTDLARIVNGGRSRKSREEIEQEILSITRPRWVRRCLSAVVFDEEDGGFSMKVVEDKAARRRLETEIFGKRILFSDHEDWSVAEIVSAYRSQWHVEADFRQMKDLDVVYFSRCSTGPIRRSECTPSTAPSPSPSRD